LIEVPSLLRPVLDAAGSGPRESNGPDLPHDELHALVELVRRGDRAALRTFLRILVPDLLRVVRRVLGSAHPDLEDTTYEAAYAVVDSLTHLRGDGTVRYFARRVAVLTAMNVRRRDAAQKRLRERDDADPDTLAAGVSSPEEDALSASLLPIIRELVGDLPEPLAEALTLHVFLGYTVAEIAEACEAPLETIRSRLRLARQSLRRAVLGSPRLREVFEVSR